MRWRWFLHCVALPFVFVLAASPMLILNTIQFHSPLKTGYDLWASYFSRHHLLFCLRWVPKNALALWKESTLLSHGYNVAHMFGTGISFVPVFLLLTCVGFFLILFNWFIVSALCVGFISFVSAFVWLLGSN